MSKTGDAENKACGEKSHDFSQHAMCFVNPKSNIKEFMDNFFISLHGPMDAQALRFL